jgi:hypothetical protein
MTQRFLKVWLLRLVGTVELGAFVAVVMPRHWMEVGHSWLGLGEMPDGAIVNFIIRQASFTYGLHGVLLWVLSWDVVRFRPLIMFTGISYLVAAPVFLVIDWASGMPSLWTIGDGGSCLVFGGALLYLDWWENKWGRSRVPQLKR